ALEPVAIVPPPFAVRKKLLLQLFELLGLDVGLLLHCSINSQASFAEELEHVGGGGARLAEGDPAVPAQRELLAAKHDLLVALDGDEGAVRAVVGEDELVEAPLDLAVRARGHALLDDEVGRGIAA